MRRWHRQRLEDHRIEQREDGGVDANAEGERRHDNQRERPSVEQAAECVLQVLPQVIRPCERSHFSMDLLGLRHTAKIAQRRQARVVPGQPARDVVVGGFGQMAGDLLVEIALVPSRAHKGGPRRTNARNAFTTGPQRS